MAFRNLKRRKDVEEREDEEVLLQFASHNQQDISESRFEELPLDKVLFRKWQEDNKQFVETKASREVEGLIKCQNIVIVIGHTGSGKSAIMHHVALKCRNQGWSVKPICAVMDMIQIINVSTGDFNDRTIFVLSDPIGKDSFDEIEYNLWRRYEENLKACLKKVKLLMSCKKYIFSDDRVKGLLKDKSHVVDLSNETFKLSIEEKENIWIRHDVDKTVSRKELKQILKTEKYFPLLCKLYFSKKNYKNRKEKLRFFKAPVAIFKEEIRHFRKSDKDKYCALVLLVLFNNDLCIEDIRDSATSRETYNLALELCEMKKNTAPHSIGDAFETLQGYFVKKSGDTYQFYHDFVMEVTTFVFGTDYPLELIQYADIAFLKKKVKLECHDQSDQFTIYLRDKHIDALGKRLFNDIFGERLLDVVLNPCLKNEKVINFFINELEHHPEKLEMLLEKKKLQIDYQEINQTTNNLFLSKLVFVILEEEISPLCAIIIFCDTSLSLYCLKSLQQMPHYFKGNFLLSSVCCNGSKDLLALFEKDHVRECLAELWKFLYPVHIASAFNNTEILGELIEIGVDVNLKTTDENFSTPLTLATGNDIDETKENDMRKSSHLNRRGMIQLLLSNGACINLCKENGASPLYIACQSGNDDIVQLLLSNGADTDLCMKDGASPLHIACQEENDIIVQTLLSNGANINLSMKDGTRPLFKACHEGHENTVKVLLQHGADINFCMKDGTSPLYIACQEGHDIIVKCLMENGADVNLCKENGTSPLYIACHMERNDIVQHLLSKGADINFCNDSGVSLLLKACHEGHENTVKVLLRHGADINFCMKDGTTPFHIACQKGRDKIIKMLLIEGVNVNLCKENGASPLYVACQMGHESIVQILLSNGADINSYLKDGTSPLYIACQEGHDAIVKLLLNYGTGSNLCNEYGISHLFESCKRGQESIVQRLLNNGVDVNVCNKYGASSLYQACREGQTGIAQLLLRNGAYINLCKENKASPLLTACLHGHVSIVQLLLSNKAKVNSCNKYGASPLYVACKHGQKRIAQLLISNGAAVNLCKENKNSPLYTACKHGHDTIVYLLLNKGADINLRNTINLSSLDIALQRGYESIVQLLRNHGAFK
eukprot:XP_019928777.1 PREDICTED: ankyrin-1-like [Crassostrea gigas]